MDAPAALSRAEIIHGPHLTDMEFAIPALAGESPRPAASPSAPEDGSSELALEAARFTAELRAEDDALEAPASSIESEELSSTDEGALHREDAPLELEFEAVDDVDPDSVDPDSEELDLEAELERELQPLESAPEPVLAEAQHAPMQSGAAPDLETVELELTLRHEDLVKLTFEDSLKAALDRLGGTLLFDMRLDNVQDCQRVAAVRLGDGDDKQFALVIMPPSGGPVRVEPTSESDNPLAAIAESYDGLMTALKMAA